jgi:hypothetical protein
MIALTFHQIVGNQSQSDTLSMMYNISFVRAYFWFVYFVVSQQMVLVSIISKSCLGEFNGQVMRFKNDLNCQESDSPSRRVILVELLRLHMEILCFAGYSNILFSPINCFLYLLDFVTCMGFFVGLTAGRGSLAMFIVVSISVLLFMERMVIFYSYR